MDGPLAPDADASSPLGVVVVDNFQRSEAHSDAMAQAVIRRAWRSFLSRRNLMLSKLLRRLCPSFTQHAAGASVTSSGFLSGDATATPVSPSVMAGEHYHHEILLWMEAIVASYMSERDTFKKYNRQHVRSVRNRRWSIGEKGRPRDVIAFLPQAIVPSDLSSAQFGDNEGGGSSSAGSGSVQAPVAVFTPTTLQVTQPLSSPSSSAPSGRSTPPQVSFPPYVLHVGDDHSIRESVAFLRGPENSVRALHKDRSLLSPVTLSPRAASMSTSMAHHREMVRVLEIPSDGLNRSISGSSNADAPSPPLFLDHNDSSDPFISGRTTAMEAIDEVARSMSFLAPDGATWPRRGSIPRVSPSQYLGEWSRGNITSSHAFKDQGYVNVDAARRLEWLAQPAAYAAARRQLNLQSMNDIVASFDASDETHGHIIHFGGSRRQSLQTEYLIGSTSSDLGHEREDEGSNHIVTHQLMVPEVRLASAAQEVAAKSYESTAPESSILEECPPTITIGGSLSIAPVGDATAVVASSPPTVTDASPGHLVHQISGKQDEILSSVPVAHDCSAVDETAQVVDASITLKDTLDSDHQNIVPVLDESQSPLSQRRREAASPLTQQGPRNAMENFAKRHAHIKPFSSYGALMDAGPRRGSPLQDGRSCDGAPLSSSFEGGTHSGSRATSPGSRSGTPLRRPTSTRMMSLRERIEEQRRQLKADPQLCGVVDRQVAMLGTLRRNRAPRLPASLESVANSTAVARPGSAMSNSEIIANPSSSPSRVVTRSFTPAVERTRFTTTPQSRVPPLLRSKARTPMRDSTYHVPSSSAGEAAAHYHNEDRNLRCKEGLVDKKSRAALVTPMEALRRKHDITVAKERSALEPSRQIAKRIELTLIQQQNQRSSNLNAEPLRGNDLTTRSLPLKLPREVHSGGSLATREDVEWLKRFHATTYY